MILTSYFFHCFVHLFFPCFVCFPSFSNFVIFSKFSRYFCTFSIFQLSQISEFMFVCFHFSRFFLLCSYMFLFSFGKREKMANQIKKIRRTLPKDEKLIAGFAYYSLFLQSFASFLLFFTFLFLPNAINSYTFPIFLNFSIFFLIFFTCPKKIGKHIRKYKETNWAGATISRKLMNIYDFMLQKRWER